MKQQLDMTTYLTVQKHAADNPGSDRHLAHMEDGPKGLLEDSALVIFSLEPRILVLHLKNIYHCWCFAEIAG